jgi:hypothetical protein
MNSIEDIESITNGSFLYNEKSDIQLIKDYDQLDIDIIMNLENKKFDYLNNDNINILLDNLIYQKSVLSHIEFNKLLYDISNNNLKDLNELVEYHKKLIFYMNNM